MVYQLATVIHCARGDSKHAPTALARQFPEMRKLSVSGTKRFQKEIKRIQNHVLTTLNGALKAMHMADIRQVRRLMISGTRDPHEADARPAGGDGVNWPPRTILP